MNKTLSKVMGFLGTALALVTGLFLFERSKRKSAEALNDNLETKEKVNSIEAEIRKNHAILGVEEADRKKQKELIEKNATEKLSDEDLADFLNRRK